MTPPAPSCSPGAAAAADSAASARDAAGGYYDVTDPPIRIPVLPKPGNPPPPSPGATGRVVTRFIVDTLGRVEPGTVAVIKASDVALANAVLTVLPGYAFTPASTHAGCKVRQIVQLPFEFR